MNFSSIHTDIFKKGEDLFAFFCDQYTGDIPENTVLVISSKVVALSQKRISQLPLAVLVEQESDHVFSHVGNFFLTENAGIIIPNAGIDSSNVENSHQGNTLLWPKNPQVFADKFRENLQTKYQKKNIGVIISDSRITPRRRGTTGVALAWSGIFGVYDVRGETDIFGKKMEVSTLNIADNAVSGAEILMGQTDEKSPFVAITNFPEKYFTQSNQHPTMAVMPSEEDLFQIL